MVYENTAGYIGGVFLRRVHCECIVLCPTVVLYYFSKLCVVRRFYVDSNGVLWDWLCY
jgi:hypothetical protein